MILIYTGKGKGKTTGAMGLAMRAWGHNKRVLFISFLKGSSVSGEFKAIKRIDSPDFKVDIFGRECLYPGSECCPGKHECILTSDNVKDDDRLIIEQGLKYSKKEIAAVNWNLIILDEIINLYNLFPEYRERIIELLNLASPDIDLVLTGRNCAEDVERYADLITEMKMVKHPFTMGIPAKTGIDY